MMKELIRLTLGVEKHFPTLTGRNPEPSFEAGVEKSQIIEPALFGHAYDF